MTQASTHHLLVVDDDQVRRLLVTVLEREGFRSPRRSMPSRPCRCWTKTPST